MALPPSVTVALANRVPYEGTVLTTAPSEAQIAAAVATTGTTIGSPFASGVTDIIYSQSLSNISVLRTDGIDFNVEYGMNTAIGRLTLVGQANKILSFEKSLTPASAPIESFDVVGRPVGFSARGAVTLSKEQWSFSMVGNYKDSYIDDIAETSAKIDSNTTLDLYSVLQLSDVFPQIGEGWILSASLVNAFDSDPPFTNSLGRAWDGANYSPIGRAFGVELGKRWGRR